MNKRNKIITISVFSTLLIVIILYLISGRNTLCKSVEVEFLSKGNKNFIAKEDILAIVKKEYKNIVKIPVNKIDITLLESKIENHPSVKKANVYKKIDGVLYIEVKQRIPLVRIINKKGKNFYIDEEGSLMPVSERNTARVIVASGNIEDNFSGEASTIYNDSLNFKYLKNIFYLSRYLSRDKFLSAQIEQIYITEKGEYELVPRVGQHIVLLGSIIDYKNKIRQLKYFYLNVLNRQGWNKYKYINLKFNKQIVCTKIS